VICRVLVTTTLPRHIIFSMHDGACRHSPKRHQWRLCCHAYADGTGILTGFLFANTPLLGARLRSANPCLIDIGKEPLPFQRTWFSHVYDPTTARILNAGQSLRALARSSARPARLPITTFWVVCRIGSEFSPVHLQDPRP